MRTALRAPRIHAVAPAGLALALLAAPAPAQSFGPWHALGHFDHPEGAGNVDAPTSVEKNLRRLRANGPGIDLAETHTVKGGVEAAWTEVAGGSTEPDVGALDFTQLLPAPAGVSGWSENALVYLYRAIESTSDTTYALSCGSDDGLRVWFNGELVLDANGARKLNPASNALSLPLERGTNHLLVKVSQGGGAFGFRMLPASDVRVDQPAINAAIDRGAQWLLARQLLDGSWPQHPEYQAGATGYAAYCLLVCGVDRDHPAIERARAYVLANPSSYTYSNACELLFLCELGRPEDSPAIEERVARVLDAQVRTGLFAYPVHPAGHGHDDLSITLYAALGLRAAHKYGASVPERVWERTIAGTLDVLEPLPRSRKDDPRGFSYRIGTAITGSMTTAGISVLEVAREVLGELPGSRRVEIEHALSGSLKWLYGRMDWSTNPGEGGHHYFWLYGIERVGSLRRTPMLGGIPWYANGSEYLLGVQADAGDWKGNVVDTVLALLFLKRATAPVTERTQSRPNYFESAADAEPVRIAVQVGSGLSAWVLELSRAERERLAWPDARGGGVRVARVEFFGTPGDGGEPRLLARSELDGAVPARNQRMAARAELPGRGEWTVVARVHALLPPVDDVAAPESVVLESAPVDVRVADVLHREQLDYAREARENGLRRLRERDVSASASSTKGGSGAKKAIDFRQGSAWESTPKDAEPWWLLETKRAVRASEVALSHAGAALRHADRARAIRVRVTVNGNREFEAELVPDPLRKTVVPFGESLKVRKLEVRVLARSREGAVGFAEVELLERR